MWSPGWGTHYPCTKGLCWGGVERHQVYGKELMGIGKDYCMQY
jgi:hypothetical protein